MQRILGSWNLLSPEVFSSNLIFVRWRRKPRWLPVAKSKLFRIPEKPFQSEDEKLELLRLHNHYKTQLRSIRSYLQTQAKTSSTSDHFVISSEQNEQEMAICEEKNNLWNSIIAKERNKRLETEMLGRKKLIEEKLEAAETKKQETIERIEKIVKEQKEKSVHFINQDNLAQAIELAIANPVDYNYCIDLEGKIYKGRSTFLNTNKD